MNHILFLPGTFGTTVQYVVQTFSVGSPNDKTIHTELITNDGSMHLAEKTGHWVTRDSLEKFFNKELDQDITVSTPIYPMVDAHVADIVELFKYNCPADKYVFIYVNDVPAAELNMLMQYYKISKGVLSLSLDIFCGTCIDNIKNWNLKYSHWSHMQQWELREWLSLFYTEWINEWIVARHLAPDSWLKISSDDILNNTLDTCISICDYFGGLDSLKIIDLREFLITWRSAQQYIIDEYILINEIVKSTIAGTRLTWRPLNIISEAIIQQKLRSHGCNIKCYNLNSFPTNSLELRSLLEDIEEDIE